MISVLFSACSSDDGSTDDGPGQSDNITGTWQVVQIVGSHTTFGTEEATDVEGTIRFNANGTGKEDYSFMVFGIPVFENDNFTWISTDTQIVTDPGDSSGQTWIRLTNTASTQEARYGDSEGFTYTFTLKK